MDLAILEHIHTFLPAKSGIIIIVKIIALIFLYSLTNEMLNCCYINCVNALRLPLRLQIFQTKSDTRTPRKPQSSVFDFVYVHQRQEKSIWGSYRNMLNGCSRVCVKVFRAESSRVHVWEKKRLRDWLSASLGQSRKEATEVFAFKQQSGSSQVQGQRITVTFQTHSVTRYMMHAEKNACCLLPLVCFEVICISSLNQSTSNHSKRSTLQTHPLQRDSAFPSQIHTQSTLPPSPRLSPPS